MLLIIKHFKIL